MVVHYLPVAADLMPALPHWALSLRSTYFAIFVVADCADATVMNSNPLVKCVHCRSMSNAT